jgi:hypothetical protein
MVVAVTMSIMVMMIRDFLQKLVFVVTMIEQSARLIDRTIWVSQIIAASYKLPYPS